MTQTPSSTTAAAPAAMYATKEQIARGIIEDEEPRGEQLTHREKCALVMATFGADTIDFDEVFDYGIALCSTQPHVVEAWRTLALLQGIYIEQCYVYQWIDEPTYHRLSDYFRVVSLNLDWHIRCLFTGVYKPLYVVPETPIY